MESTSTTILIVDDNKDLLKTLKLSLQRKKYHVLTAENGKIALDLLHETSKLPDIIISDILMPEMNGYDFFRAISNEPRLNQIPFIFLTERSTSEDIRLGKMLGADDYVSKPFKIEDLLAIIQGKIARSKNIARINEKFAVDILPPKEFKSTRGDSTVYLLHAIWDDKMGPSLEHYYPIQTPSSFSLKEITFQLYQASNAIYGQVEWGVESRSILLTIVNISRNAFIFFDSMPDLTLRTRSNLYMLAVIASNISYFESLSITKILSDLSITIKEKKPWKIDEYHSRILTILKTGN